MDIEKLPLLFTLNNLKKLHLLGDDGSPVPYSVFKNRASISKYGKQGKDQLKIVFVGIPKENLFGFYVNCAPDNEAMKEAYAWYLYLIKGQFDKIDVQFGNKGFPHCYAGLRYEK